MTRRATTETICAVPDCTAEREWCNRDGKYRSRWRTCSHCGKHRRQIAQQQKAQQQRQDFRAQPGAPCTPAQVLAAWEARPNGGGFRYHGSVLAGLMPCADGGYLAQFLGSDVSVRLDADAALERVVKL